VKINAVVIRVVSVVAANDSDYDKWVKGLNYLVDDCAQSSYAILVER